MVPLKAGAAPDIVVVVGETAVGAVETLEAVVFDLLGLVEISEDEGPPPVAPGGASIEAFLEEGGMGGPQSSGCVLTKSRNEGSVFWSGSFQGKRLTRGRGGEVSPGSNMERREGAGPTGESCRGT